MPPSIPSSSNSINNTFFSFHARSSGGIPFQLKTLLGGGLTSSSSCLLLRRFVLLCAAAATATSTTRKRGILISASAAVSPPIKEQIVSPSIGLLLWGGTQHHRTTSSSRSGFLGVATALIHDPTTIIPRNTTNKKQYYTNHDKKSSSSLLFFPTKIKNYSNYNNLTTTAFASSAGTRSRGKGKEVQNSDIIPRVSPMKKRAFSLPASAYSSSSLSSSNLDFPSSGKKRTASATSAFGLKSFIPTTSSQMSVVRMSSSDKIQEDSLPIMTTTTTNTTTSSPTRPLPPMHSFFNSLSNSWISHLSSETPENYESSIATAKKRYPRYPYPHPGRPIYNGHYVLVAPTPLSHPKLVIYSPDVAMMLGIHVDENEEIDEDGDDKTNAFVKYFSGDIEGAIQSVYEEHPQEHNEETLTKKKMPLTWATPYALSIMGRRYTSNCPYGTGDGYGDGRAISVGEVLVPIQTEIRNRIPEDNNNDAALKDPPNDDDDDDDDHRHPLESLYPKYAARYELQLKGAGQTPFCRGADGRAVLRSSIREFLASEAMHHLGISTTRALSLIVSEGPDGDTSDRMWYSTTTTSPALPGLDDPRLSSYNDEQKREILRRLSTTTKHDPDRLVQEKCAITTRVAPSFVRIGHLDLFARRVEMLRMKSDGLLSSQMEYDSHESKIVKDTIQYKELKEMFWHACYREYYDEAYAPYYEKKDATSAAIALMEGAMQRIAVMVAGWIRVGFIQGNFNADNCLVGGRTMDYGPFGFMDVYHPLSAKWTGSGEHFGFMNQPNAGFANFAVLVESLMPIIDANHKDVNEIRDEMLTRGQSVFADAVDDAIRSKLGLVGGSPDMITTSTELWERIEPLLRTARADWTLFWRQLTYVATKYSPAKNSKNENHSAEDYDDMLIVLLGEGNIYPFYDNLSDDNRAFLRAWIEKWHSALITSFQHARKESTNAIPPEEIMRLANPKYVLKEWMLVDAYTKADRGTSKGNPFYIPADYSGVHELFELCKDPYGEGTDKNHVKYYRRAPDESLQAGGTAFMS